MQLSDGWTKNFNLVEVRQQSRREGRGSAGEEAGQDGAGSCCRKSPARLRASDGSWLSSSPHRRCLYFLIMTYFLNKRGFSKRSSADEAAITFQGGWVWSGCGSCRGVTAHEHAVPAGRGGPGVPCVHVREEPPRGPVLSPGHRRTGPSRAPSWPRTRCERVPGPHASRKPEEALADSPPSETVGYTGHGKGRNAPGHCPGGANAHAPCPFRSPRRQTGGRRPREDAGAVAEPRPAPPGRDSPPRRAPQTCWEARAALSSKAAGAGGPFVPRFSLSRVCSVQHPLPHLFRRFFF